LSYPHEIAKSQNRNLKKNGKTSIKHTFPPFFSFSEPLKGINEFFAHKERILKGNSELPLNSELD
jgi:hypothetical protein